MTTDHRHAQVKEHYRALAAEYGDRANQTCERAYRRIVRRSLGDRRRLLELGGGSTDLLGSLGSPLAVACDLSLEMLRMRPDAGRSHRVAAACERLPFPDARFDGAFCINVLEHVADVDRVLAESARVLDDGGLWLAVTPNGNWETWLDLAERWKLKIPEGAHTFLTTRALDLAVRAHLEVLEHRTFLVLPAGPPALAALIDRITACNALGWGFFQYIVARKRDASPAGDATASARHDAATVGRE